MNAFDAASTFEKLFEGRFAAVAATAAFIVGDRSSGEDIAQEAFARLLARPRILREYELPEAWVRRVAVREAVKRARAMQRVAAMRADHDAPDFAERSVENVDLARALRAL